jgi:thioredoxin reductase (NADPH)
MPEKVVIIGSGPAGWTAAIYAARSRLSPLVYEGAAPLGQLNLTTEVENFPGWPFADTAALAEFSKSSLPPERFYNVSHHYEGKNVHHGKRGVTGPELMEYMRQQAVNFETQIVTDDIVKVDFQRHPFVLTTAQGETIETLTVIVATGARANWLNLPTEETFKNRGVSACATCDGALPRFKDRPIVVVGGGDTAMEEANHLAKFGSKIYLVHRRDQFRASPIMQQRVLANSKVEVKWNSAVEEVIGTPEGVTGVRLKSTKGGGSEELKASGLFVAIGHTPNTDFLGGQLALEPGGYIKWTTPQRSFTSVEGVFAAGDVADSYYRQAVTAAGTGCMAALDAERWLAAKGHH